MKYALKKIRTLIDERGGRCPRITNQECLFSRFNIFNRIRNRLIPEENITCKFS